MPDQPTQPGESTLKNTQGNPPGQSDDPRQAKESGDPQAEARLGGRPIDEQTNAGKSDGGGDSKDWESGRHQAK